MLFFRRSNYNKSNCFCTYLKLEKRSLISCCFTIIMAGCGVGAVALKVGLALSSEPGPGVMSCRLHQSEASTEVRWPALTNQRPGPGGHVLQAAADYLAVYTALTALDGGGTRVFTVLIEDGRHQDCSKLHLTYIHTALFVTRSQPVVEIHSRLRWNW